MVRLQVLERVLELADDVLRLAVRLHPVGCIRPQIPATKFRGYKYFLPPASLCEPFAGGKPAACILAYVSEFQSQFEVGGPLLPYMSAVSQNVTPRFAA